MTSASIETLAQASLSVTLEYNPHKTTYETVEQYLHNRFDWANAKIEDEIPAEDLRLMTETDTIWAISRYPSNPVGFEVVYAPTLERALEVMQAE